MTHIHCLLANLVYATIIHIYLRKRHSTEKHMTSLPRKTNIVIHKGDQFKKKRI